ncbi:hypothetical protein [Bacillus sp. T33-2]|uniref:hypothetical protein n=1 Tax=Bacillus sp. T33-2 TaxID=2054168 RepID=UPI0021554771|nr:hypothetical protein [Bacillus sp. T33-2]
MTVWETKYKMHTIRVENTWKTEKLYVDGELQDERIGYKSESRLYGRIRTGENETEYIKVSIGAYWFTVQCRIFVSDRLVFSSES